MKNIEDRLPWIEAIIDYSEDAIISKDLNNIIVSWNKGAEKLYGYTEDEVVGKHIKLIIPEDKLSDVASTAEIIEQREDIIHLETVRIAKDGTRYDVSVSVSPIFNSKGELIGSSAIARNITEGKRHQEMLRKSEERYRKIVELSPDTILIHQDGKIKFINQAGLTLLGCTDEQQIIGQSIWNIYTPDRHGIVRSNNQTMKFTEQPISNVEHTIVRLDGKTINVETSACAINYDGTPAIYVIMRDITERKKVDKFLELQYAIANSLIKSTNLIDGITDIIRVICNTMNLDVGKIWLFNKNEDLLTCVSSWANDELSSKRIDKIKTQMSLKVNQGLPGKVWANNEPYWENLTQDNSIYANNDFKLGIAVPIYYKNEFFGVLELLNSRMLSKDVDFLNALRSMCSQIGTFVNSMYADESILFSDKHDALTQLANRKFLEETMTFELYRAKSKRQRLAILLLDIDNFSAINESAGYDVGDQILKIIANVLSEEMQLGDNVARFGGDQFVILRVDFNSIEEITVFIQKLNTNISNALQSNGIQLNVQVNIGISLYPEDNATVKELLKNASIALSKAKKSGHGAFQFCTSDMSLRAQKRIIIENDLGEAQQKQEFILHYQPSIDTKNMKIIGFEALLRWNYQGKIVPPVEFIDVLEESKLIVPVGKWILKTACQQCAQWQDKAPGTSISVNISPVQFHNSNVIEDIKEALKFAKLDPGLLKIEITESAIMDDIHACIKILQQIKDMGVKIAIDDFGTGYSSLSYLPDFPIDYLKIDRSFIMHMLADPKDATIVKTIIGLAKNLDFFVIAEGIETEAQLQFINELGCFEIQGYYFSRPLGVKEAEDLLVEPKKYL